MTTTSQPGERQDEPDRGEHPDRPWGIVGQWVDGDGQLRVSWRRSVPVANKG